MLGGINFIQSCLPPSGLSSPGDLKNNTSLKNILQI